MWKLKHLFMNAEQGAEQPGGGNGGGEDGGNNPGAGEPSGNSLLSTGAGEPGANDWLPEKFRVMGEDGKLSIESSARKLAENYTHLEKRMGSGDAPPKTADEYAPKVEVEGFNWEEFKADPRMQGFMKTAHAKGITNDQMSFIWANTHSELLSWLAVPLRLIRKQPPRSCAKCGRLTQSLSRTSVWLSGRLIPLLTRATEGALTRSAITRWLSACWLKSVPKCRRMCQRAAM